MLYFHVHYNGIFLCSHSYVPIQTQAFLRICRMWMSGQLNSGSCLSVGISSQRKCCWSSWNKTPKTSLAQMLFFWVFMNHKRIGSHLKKLSFHFWVDPFCALLIAADDTGFWSGQQLQTLHQRNNRLCGQKIMMF